MPVGNCEKLPDGRVFSLNDLLLRDMFLAVNEWNKQAGVKPGWLRVLMPTNLRLPRDEHMPAANMVSLSFITRHSRECRQPRELLDGIRCETDSIKRIRRGLYFIRVIEVAQAMCGRMPKLLVGRRCRASVVLSNLGDLGHWFAQTFPACRGPRRGGQPGHRAGCLSAAHPAQYQGGFYGAYVRRAVER